ncbi:7-cyano-7-deazaguanine synthase in queuosine biosynthesis [Xanthomonas campestris]
MSRHTLVMRIGADDIADPGQRLMSGFLTELPRYSSFASIDHQIGDTITQLQAIGLRPSERALDLAVLAAAITAADTRISRDVDAQDGWTRQIELCVPVSDSRVWMDAASLIERTLNFLTGDLWLITFRERAASVQTLIPAFTGTLMEKPQSVCLFSGGLDSFIGAVDLLSEGERILLVSHYWDRVTSKYQKLCLDALEEQFGKGTFESVRAYVGFPKGAVADSHDEDTLRGRSFLFFALAALAADAIGDGTVIHVPENGLISLNVPLDPLRLGALSTRTTHPYYMARFNEILRSIGLTSRLENRYRHRTKGQMVAECADGAFLRVAAANTMSCSAPAKMRFEQDEQRRQPKNCGHCVPCLIRRAALLHGFGADDTEYQLEELGARALDSTRAAGEHVRSFQFAIAQLAARPQRARFDIHKPGPLTDHPGDWVAYEQVYRDGISEVAALLNGVVSRPGGG